MCVVAYFACFKFDFNFAKFFYNFVCSILIFQSVDFEISATNQQNVMYFLFC